MSTDGPDVASRTRSPRSPRCTSSTSTTSTPTGASSSGGHSATSPDADRAVVVDLDRERHRPPSRPPARPTPYASPFPEPVHDSLQLQLLGVGAGPHGAGTKLGQDELTLIEREVAELAAIRTFITSVVRTETITRGIRQITFGGGDLATFRPISADQFLYVLAPPAGRTELTIDATFTWEQFAAMPRRASSRSAPTTPCGGGGPSATSSTCCSCSTASTRRRRRRHRRPGGALGRDGGAGRPGRPVGATRRRSPRRRHRPVPPRRRRHRPPGVAAIIDSLPPARRSTSSPRSTPRRTACRCPSSAGVTVTWCYRRGAAPGTTTALVDAVRALDWPAGTPYAWGGAESKAITAVRRHLRDERGLPQDAVSMTGYWRLGDH